MHVMLDIETLGTRPGSIVTCIAAVQFELNGADLDLRAPQDHEREYVGYPSIEDQQLLGRTFTSSTLHWWMQQDALARAMALAPSKEVPLGLAVAELDMFIDGAEGVWGHGAAFDVALLLELYRDMDVDPSWSYRLPRDTRTLFQAAEFTPESIDPELAHNALADARHQVNQVKQAFRELSVLRDKSWRYDSVSK